MTFFSNTTYRLAFIALLLLLAATVYHRTAHFDDAWFAEQSYWLVRDGVVRSALFAGYNGWETKLYVFHKLFIYAGAGLMSVVGFSLAGSKVLSTLCVVVAGGLLWQYARWWSREGQWLAVLLFGGCGAVLYYAAINRPELLCMTLGLTSYVALDRPITKDSKSGWAGFWAGLAALTHLNGLIYLAAGGLWLLTRAGWRPALWFGLIGGLTTSLYFADALADSNMGGLIAQFRNDPATQSNFSLTDKLGVMLGYHQVFFHSLREIPLTALTLLSLFFFRAHLRLTNPVVLYLSLLVASFWLLTKSNFNFYYLLFVPWLVLAVVGGLIKSREVHTVRQLKAVRLALLTYALCALVSAGLVIRENLEKPYAQEQNARLASLMPQKGTNIIAPIGFFFGQMDNYAIHGLTYYHLLEKQLGTLPLATFFAIAEQRNVTYVVSDDPGNMSYQIPLDGPAEIGAYRRIFRDSTRVIYAKVGKNG